MRILHVLLALLHSDHLRLHITFVEISHSFKLYHSLIVLAIVPPHHIIKSVRFTSKSEIYDCPFGIETLAGSLYKESPGISDKHII